MVAVIAVVAAILFVFLLILVLTSAKTVRPTERGLVERWGRYIRFANPGLQFIAPFWIDKLYRVNITEQMVSSEKREIITKDSLNAVVDSNIYFKVKSNEADVKASQYGVNNYRVQIVALAKTTLRNIIGTMTLVEANSDRNKINKALYDLLSEETENWGIEIVRTELKEIVPPEKVQAQMNEVVIAQNKMIAAADFASATETEADGVRRATIKRAEGDRQAVILRAEGDRQAVVLRAEGDRQAVILRAGGESEAIKLVNEAAQKYFTGNAQLLKQLETVATSLKDNAKIVLPEGERLVNIIGNLAGTDAKKT